MNSLIRVKKKLLARGQIYNVNVKSSELFTYDILISPCAGLYYVFSGAGTTLVFRRKAFSHIVKDVYFHLRIPRWSNYDSMTMTDIGKSFVPVASFLANQDIYRYEVKIQDYGLEFDWIRDHRMHLPELEDEIANQLASFYSHILEKLNEQRVSNQRVDPTVKMPVESGKVQGTAGHP